MDANDGSSYVATILNHTHTLAFLLQLPAAKGSIDAIYITESSQTTALSLACAHGHQACAQLLLAAGADPTIPAGHYSPLNRAIAEEHQDFATLLRRAFAEPARSRCLHKARMSLDTPIAITSARKGAMDHDLSVTSMQQAILATIPMPLKERVAWGKVLPQVELTASQGDERLRATVAFVLGLEEGRVEYQGLPWDMYMDLLGYLLPAWADNGPDVDLQEQAENDSEEDEDSESDDD